MVRTPGLPGLKTTGAAPAESTGCENSHPQVGMRASLSIFLFATESGPEKAPIIVDPVIFIAIGPCCQTPAPESEDVVTLPAPLGLVGQAGVPQTDPHSQGTCLSVSGF